MQQIPLVRISAKNNYDLGAQIGGKLKDQIRARLRATKLVYRKLGMKDFAALEARAQKFLPATSVHFPQLLAETRGMSEGAGIKFEELLVLMCEEELLDIRDINIPHCTNVALKTKNAILVGHNEDWLNSYKHNGLFVLKCNIGEHRSLSLNYIGSLAGSSCGMNSSGLCFTANSLNPGRFRYGVPVKFQFRAMLEAKTPKAAMQRDLAASSIAGNTIYGWRNSRIVDVEDFFGHHETFHGKKFLVHTNHPLLRRDRNRRNTPKESVVRFERAKEILAHKKEYTLGGLKKLLSDHEAMICSHPERHTSWGATVASVIMNPKEQWMEVCWGNPCRNKYIRYAL